jgi:BioD-like phosphotransacetylase family protein
MDNHSYEEQKQKYEELLESIADKHQVDVTLIRQLIAFEESKVHLERRRGAKDQIRKQIEDWLEGPTT